MIDRLNILIVVIISVYTYVYKSSHCILSICVFINYTSIKLEGKKFKGKGEVISFQFEEELSKELRGETKR